MVETKAGKFEAVLISLVYKGVVGNIFEQRRRWYYAPKLGMVVKFEVDHITGYDPNVKSWELTQYVPPQ